MRRTIAVCTVILSISLLSCASTRHHSPVDLISVDEELRLGELLATEIVRQYPVLSDEEINAYITTIGERIASHSDWSGLHYHFRIINTDDINSFSVPGGYVYVCRGLIEQAGLSEVTSVLAHEIAHIASRHGTEQLTLGYGLALEAQALLGENPELWRQIVANLFREASILKYGFTNEYTADRLAILYAYKAGYDPRGLVEFLEKLAVLEKNPPPTILNYSATHPPARKRLARMMRELAELEHTADLLRDDGEFSKIKGKLRSIPVGSTR